MSNKLLAGFSTLLLIIVCATSAFAVGEAGVPSLIIPPGARANGIGESYVALAEDATAAWWNPGGLGFVKGQNLALMHSQLVPDLANDVYYEFLGYTNELSGFGTIGVSLIYLTYGQSVATNAQGIEQGTFDSWEVSGLLSFALPLTPNLGVGMSGKFIHADLAPASLTLERLDGTGSSVAVDFGVLYKVPSFGIPWIGTVPDRRLSLGAALTNLGPDISFIDQEQSDPLPITMRVGFAYTALADEVSNLLVTADIEQSLVWLIDSGTNTRRSEILHGGVEYRYIDLIAGRIGYIYDEDGDFSDATYGLGFIYKGKVALDYANVPQAETLDRVHRWSVVVSF
jgi:hypothetical protein